MKRAQRFKAPPRCQVDCKEIVIKELDGNDEIAAAVEADKRVGSPGFKADSFTAMMKLERQEKIRQSIVSIDAKRRRAGESLAEFDDFHAPTRLWIATCFDKVNGLDGDDLKKSLDEAEEIDLDAQNGSAATTDAHKGG